MEMTGFGVGLWKGTGPKVFPLMDLRGLALGKRIFICQDLSRAGYLAIVGGPLYP